MLYSNYMVMSFPFITVIERNEKLKRKNVLEQSSTSTNKGCPLSKECKKKDVAPDKEHCDKYKDMVLLSNLEEVVFQTSSSKCLMDELFPQQKNKKKINYDKYLDFFE